jgi:hypothetical protein
VVVIEASRTVTEMAAGFATPIRQAALSADGEFMVAVSDSNLVGVWGK